jgi:hypothetical protein
MRKLMALIIPFIIMLTLVGSAVADSLKITTQITYTPDSKITDTTYKYSINSLTSLEHGKAYVWGTSGITLAGEIVSASLGLKNIYNWNDSTNILYMHLIDNPNIGIRSYTDAVSDPNANPNNGYGDFFDATNRVCISNCSGLHPVMSDLWTGIDTYLTSYSDTKPGTLIKDNFTYALSNEQLPTLVSYITDGGAYGIGFDSDCHFYLTSFFLKITTRQEESYGPPTEVPEPTTILLLGIGLVGLAGLKRIRDWRR